MAINVVQAVTAAKQTAAGNGFNITAFSNPVTAGNTIIVPICFYGGSLPVVTDSLGNVYVQDLRTTNSQAVGNPGVAIFRASSIVGGTAVITIKNGSNADTTQYWVATSIEVTPVTPSVAGPSNTGTGTTATAGAMTTSAAASLVVGCVETDGNNLATLSTSGFTSIGSASGGTTETFDAEYQIYSSIQTGLNMTWTWAGSTGWRAIAMAYVASPSGGGVPLIGEGLVY